MKDRHTGILIGAVACIGILAVSGFSSSNNENQAGYAGRYQLLEAVSDYHNDGTPRIAHLLLLDTEMGHVWEYEFNNSYSFENSEFAKRIDREDYPSKNYFVRIYVD